MSFSNFAYSLNRNFESLWTSNRSIAETCSCLPIGNVYHCICLVAVFQRYSLVFFSLNSVFVRLSDFLTFREFFRSNAFSIWPNSFNSGSSSLKFWQFGVFLSSVSSLLWNYCWFYATWNQCYIIGYRKIIFVKDESILHLPQSLVSGFTWQIFILESRMIWIILERISLSFTVITVFNIVQIIGMRN